MGQLDREKKSQFYVGELKALLSGFWERHHLAEDLMKLAYSCNYGLL